MRTAKISADEAHEVRKAHLRDRDGRECILKVASAPATWNADNRSARFVMTSQTKDRYGDVVVTDGVVTEQFDKNPVGFLNHNSADWPIGDWANVQKISKGRPPRMEGDLVLHEAGGPIPTVDQAAWMIERGYMRACSIGFIPDWNEVERVLEDDGSWMGGIRFNKAELLECSLCGVPANPQALAKGIIEAPLLAQGSIEHVLDTWARGSDGSLIERKAFEDLYQIVKRDEADMQILIEQKLEELNEPVALALCEKFLIAKGRAMVTKERIEAIERAARNKRLDERRRRELDAIKTSRI